MSIDSTHYDRQPQKANRNSKLTLVQIIVLAIVQGITEFLPVSSSGHLVLVPSIFGWTDQGLAFDVAVHVGSLVAVTIYFRHDIAALISGTLEILGGKPASSRTKMVWCIGIGTIPAAIAGLLFASWIAANLRDPLVVVATLSGYAILMAIADRWGKQDKTIADISVWHGVIIGLAQALALVPGTSRSGITITAGRLLGIQRQDAARFSFLLSAPVILLAAIYQLVILVTGEAAVPWDNLAIAASVACIVAYLSIDFFMRFVSALGLLPFAIYRLVLAGVIVYVLF
jgi:undecaprenyl-diphosphatase